MLGRKHSVALDGCARLLINAIAVASAAGSLCVWSIVQLVLLSGDFYDEFLVVGKDV